jgi:hypothetical protein
MFDTDRPSWQNPRVLSILVLVFLCGAAFGALTMRATLRARLHPNSNSNFWKNETLLSYDKLTRDEELKLSPEQCRQLRGILDDYARYHQDLQAQMDDWKATGKNQILRILDAGQRARFEQMIEVR